MNREIKFRGLRKDGKGWIFGWLFKDMLTGKMCIQQDTYSTMSDTGHKVKEVIGREVIPETVGQFTGMLDMKGQEIWEGDRVKAGMMHHGIRGTLFDAHIRYNHHVGTWQIQYEGAFGGNPTDDIGFTYKLEVIGNIHESEAPNE